MSAINEQLFTELTTEQSAAVEGGALLYIQKIQAIKADADSFSADDTYIKINGVTCFGPRAMNTGSVAVVDRARAFSGSANFVLLDKDGFLQGSDDYLGGFTVSSASTNGIVRRRVSGSGSTYDVYYSVI